MEREKPTEYRLNAADCFRFAQRVANPQQRQVLLIVARAWLLLARFIEKRRRLVDADTSWRDYEGD
jgi:hypothetical protein